MRLLAEAQSTAFNFVNKQISPPVGLFSGFSEVFPHITWFSTADRVCAFTIDLYKLEFQFILNNVCCPSWLKGFKIHLVAVDEDPVWFLTAAFELENEFLKLTFKPTWAKVLKNVQIWASIYNLMANKPQNFICLWRSWYELQKKSKWTLGWDCFAKGFSLLPYIYYNWVVFTLYAATCWKV